MKISFNVRFGVAWVLLACGLTMARAADKLPAIASVPPGFPLEVRTRLEERRSQLEAARTEFLHAAKVFNDKAAKDQSDAEFNAVQTQRTNYGRSVEAFNREVRLAYASVRVAAGVKSFAAKLGWPPDKLREFQGKVDQLSWDGDPDVTDRVIAATWQTIDLQSNDAALQREAGAAGNLGFPASGTQTVHEDCTIFALATATGRPYGVVAAQAAGFIRDGDWRHPDDRADPQKAIEGEGMFGGEVLLVAESFGQSQVVPMNEFAANLREGHPVAVAVVPRDGEVDASHEVVLTNTFQHAGETWYSLVDSNEGPVRRLFLSHAQLDIVLQERGIVYRPDRGKTPALLR